MTATPDRHAAPDTTPARALSMSTLAFTICFAVWTIFSIIGVRIKDDLGLSETEFGLLVGTPILTGSLVRMALGIWTDRYGGRLVYTFTMLAAALATFLLSFAETYGETPMRYLTRRRIERAQDLLRSANLTITEVCMLVGFSSLGSFSSRFRELVGESPTEYRDRWAARGGPYIPGCFLLFRGVDPWPDAQPEPEPKP
jgi:MFS family permease